MSGEYKQQMSTCSKHQGSRVGFVKVKEIIQGVASYTAPQKRNQSSVVSFENLSTHSPVENAESNGLVRDPPIHCEGKGSIAW